MGSVVLATFFVDFIVSIVLIDASCMAFLLY